MKKGIHPEYNEIEVKCGGCGATFVMGSTSKSLSMNVCSECHPFYTGKQRFVDSEGRVDAFKKKYAKFQKTAPKKEEKAAE